jgi:protein-L-isoaspartate(D-aspartate) O-methyltransferase
MVASMTAYLDIHATDRVLEIGTGSGYQAAVLAQLAEMVYTVERIPELSDQAQQRLNALGIDNVRYKTDDGTLGWQEESPFDRILVTAAAPQLPHDLANQLTADGRMVIPIGDANQQTLTIVEKRKGRLVEMPQYSCRFVKLIGHQGWPDDKR